MPHTHPLPPLDPRRHSFFLDFDGTLTPIVDIPDDAVLSPEASDLLSRLAEAAENRIAIVSGRSLDDLAARVGQFGFALAGSHGLEIRGTDGNRIAPDMAALPDHVLRTARDWAEARGLMLERKPGSFALHYRSAPDRQDEARAFVDDLVTDIDGYRAIHGDMVSEVASATVTKGTALKQFCEAPPFQGTIPVMIGDDVTDEDGFAAATDLGGFGVKIGKGPTNATYRLQSTDAFLDWLALVTGRTEQRAG